MPIGTSVRDCYVKYIYIMIIEVNVKNCFLFAYCSALSSFELSVRIIILYELFKYASETLLGNLISSHDNRSYLQHYKWVLVIKYRHLNQTLDPRRIRRN